MCDGVWQILSHSHISLMLRGPCAPAYQQSDFIRIDAFQDAPQVKAHPSLSCRTAGGPPQATKICNLRSCLLLAFSA